MPNFVQNKRIMVMKLESTAGTAESLVDADFNVRFRDPEFTFEISQDDGKFARGDHGEDANIAGVRAATVTAATRLCDSTGVAVAPKWSKVLQACGCKEVAYTTTGIGWQPLAEMDCKTATVEVFDISCGASPVAIKEQAAGCVGTLSIGAESVGAPIMASVQFRGKYTANSDVANANILELTSPDTAEGIAFIGATCTIGALTVAVQSFSLDTGNGVEMIQDAAQATGIQYAAIRTRAPRLTISVLKDTVANLDVKTLIQAQTEQTITLDFGTLSLVVPVAVLISSSNADAGGTVSLDLTFKCLPNDTAIAALPNEACWELLQGARA